MLRQQLWLDRIRSAVFAVFFGVPAVLLFLLQLQTKSHGPRIIYVISGAFAVVSFAQIWRCAVFFFWPHRHWIGKCLRQIDANAWELAQSIDDEWRGDAQLIEGVVPHVLSWVNLEIRFTVLTANWLIHVSRGRIAILMTDRICWIYRRITVNHSWRLRGRFHHAVCCRMGDGATEIEVATTTEPIALWLAADLMRRRPQMLSGYQGDCVDLGRTNPAMLVWRVEQRRWEFEALSRAEQALWIEESSDDLEEYPRRVDPLAPETMK